MYNQKYLINRISIYLNYMFDDVLIWLGPLIAVCLITGGVIQVIVVIISWVDVPLSNGLLI